MPSTNEISRAETWMFQTLQALVSGRCYSAVAPAGAVFPFIVFTCMPAPDLMGVGPARIWAALLYAVKVTAQTTSYASIATIADQVDAALHAASGTVSNGRILTCMRERPLSLTEELDGEQYRSLGGIFRVYVQPL